MFKEYTNKDAPKYVIEDIAKDRGIAHRAFKLAQKKAEMYKTKLVVKRGGKIIAVTVAELIDL